MPHHRADRRHGIRLLLAACALFVGACERGPEVRQEQMLAFGTVVDVTLIGTDEATAQRGFDALAAQFDAQHHAWHAWQESDLTRINDKLAAGQTTTIDGDLRWLAERGIALAEQSEHYFNPAIGRLIALWGFHARQTNPSPPPATAIDQLLAHSPRMTDLHLDGATLSSDNPAVQLDFGGMAKGLILDRAMIALRNEGIEHALISLGGDVQAIGSRGDRRWRVGVIDPSTRGKLASLEIDSGENVFTSGTYERYFEYDGKRYHHLISPKTGYPARGLTAVTVVHEDATTADAAATALLVAGPEHWQRIARNMGVDQVLIVDDSGHVSITPTLVERVRFEEAATTVTVTEAL
ncbi:hypothetical protein CAI21_00720 [Alkalilimnicola ehrlichii]|uniref:FAD:protein FMN transferase n=1 Tax=Alkalilimnicola ehrlichii TaxID=351052 RepID=A0A3E0X1M7_9GAMM|nr:FAD:protein FMN transferase [Alkalilimnicola ehrlichii]RFA31207.1 hypothetical protein CAI21_00720 [Alkalilimnicola ehrlichii]RFA39511.1 hypothetical protein CAL65_01690 [Alkalilimnicola ehrlichii]